MMVVSMSMIDAATATDDTSLQRPRRLVQTAAQPHSDAIVPQESISRTALTAVVAIMTFLAALCSGGVMVLIGAATEWQSEIAREMTIQLRPVPGRDIEADLVKAAQIARSTPGISAVRIYSREESEHLLDPWIGPGLPLDELPVPRLVAITVASGGAPDTAALRAALASDIAGASLDDHRSFVEHMRRMAGTAMGGAVALLALVLVATILSVAFATSGAMASTSQIIEVLHIVGAKEAYIANQFLRHFLHVGFTGAAIGGSAAMALFAIAQWLGNHLAGRSGATEAAALLGSLSIGPMVYMAMAADVMLIATITAIASRRVVLRTLRQMD
jgi:cell division transport system permease protein